MEEKYIKQIEHNGYVANIVIEKQPSQLVQQIYKIKLDDNNTNHIYSHYLFSNNNWTQIEGYLIELEQTFKNVIDKINPNFETIVKNLGFVKQNNK